MMFDQPGASCGAVWIAREPKIECDTSAAWDFNAEAPDFSCAGHDGGFGDFLGVGSNGATHRCR